MNEKEVAMGKFFIVESDGWASKAFESFSSAADRLLCIVEDADIHLASGSVSYWIEAADGVPLTVKLLVERRDRGTVGARTAREESEELALIVA
jgi:hypothetical protein